MSESRAAVALWAVLAAAGEGRRFGGQVAKQHLPLAGVSALSRGLSLLLAEPRVRGAAVAVAAADSWQPAPAACFGKPVHLCRGSVERAGSVLSALATLREHGAAEDDWVLVHDAARPLLRSVDLALLIDRLGGDPVGGLLAVPVPDTLKRADSAGRVMQTVSREGLWQAQTPQMFRLEPLRRALTGALAARVPVTDESSALEWTGARPLLVEGHADNIKITRREDLQLAELLLALAEARSP